MKCKDFNLNPCAYCCGEFSKFRFECWLDEIDNTLITESSWEGYNVILLPKNVSRAQWFITWLKNPWVHNWSITKDYIMAVVRHKYPELENLMVLM